MTRIYAVGFIFQLLKQSLILFFVYGLVNLVGLVVPIEHTWVTTFIIIFAFRFIVDWLDSANDVAYKLIQEKVKEEGSSEEIKKLIEKLEEEMNKKG
uniref:Holin n=1 Tax=Mammaliicoccus phage MSShimriz1 TaxID=3230127 RepID=A0AAU8GRY6_9VIRU